MKKNKKNWLFRFMFFIFFISFIVVYFSELTGYYEYQNYKRKVFTQAQIDKFEEDVKKGNKVDINDYLILENTNYDNNLSNVASKVSDGISKVVRKSVESVFKYISKLVDE